MKSFTWLLGLAVSLSLVSFACADSVTVIQTLGTGTVTYDSTTGILSASNIPITATLLQNATNQSALFSFSADLDTTGVQSFFGGLLLFDDASNVQFSIINGSTNVLSGTASSADLEDFEDSFSLTAQNPTFNQGVNFTSDVINTSTYKPDSLQINFANSSDINGNPASSTPDGNFTSFSAQLEPSAFVADVSPVPLPNSALSGAALFGLLGLTQLARLRRAALR